MQMSVCNFDDFPVSSFVVGHFSIQVAHSTGHNTAEVNKDPKIHLYIYLFCIYYMWQGSPTNFEKSSFICVAISLAH